MSEPRHDPDGAEELLLPEALVTGEAVVLDLRPASFASRALAYLLDVLVLFVIGSLLWLAVILLVPSLDFAALGAIVITTTVTIMVLVPATWETLSRGRSPGKLAAGLRVVRDDGGPVRWRQALVRWLVAVPEIYLTSGGAALICSLANPRGKRVGDLLAGTYVVRDRAPGPPPPLPPVPAHLVSWVSTADIARLPDSLALAARQFLGRRHLLNPASRQRLGRELAGQMAGSVAPAPPGAVHPEDFLAAVLAERHRRALAQLRVLEQRRAERTDRRASADVLSPGSGRLVTSRDSGEPR